ncbi:KUP/HAK/KT family potassium transporter [Segatella salivae]|jgi:probable potassium transport system protein kup|uniref:KUP/HAK/KT family potassium transporter n=1 Tax=Segatella salivae TaxID=228604 RepID=UPI001C5D6BA1|nr:KUP/HAK/KT family potassium transporter [Segatella salivae]MBF1527521.1 KUP/HAK/KT family potassium transporter [Segatella salivae]MBF1532962.1 KUP/HAK/KT family potassium transporter [Segatella salivae]MBF1560672.1 KUP/HAK/KT family potassium transporter [Segatella salivae]MBF1573423.1 KUP/HAK/KT family potassium transporter [Segatella salivae]MBW4764564.1 KUP/HAK/KT family potassium transporter [Segatella salivae]
MNSGLSTHKKLTAMGLLIAIGIVFGDIGTSPLYVMRTILRANPHFDANYILGAVSCIIWTLTLQTTLKYVIVALRADNKGEGGVLALFTLIRKRGYRWLFIVAILGASTLIADGVITPAITVTSAIEGLHGLSTDIPIVPIVLFIISTVFFIQRFGTGSIGTYFGPFMLVWFLLLGILGMIHVVDYPYIIKAFNPYYAIKLLASSPEWFLILGAVFLCTTGAEALYSDLGHCGRRNITISWIFVKVMLILNYMGQGAYIVSHSASMHTGINPFYAIMPNWLLIPGIIMATGAAIIASQALISGCFTIFSEAVHLNFWPTMKFKYPSVDKGQIYIPRINNLLYILCIITVLLFQTSAHMEAAYGLSITITMLTTTVMLAVYLKQRFTPHWLVIAFLLVYLLIEGFFFLANLTKFAHGGWFTIMLALIAGSTMYIWYRASNIRRKYLKFKKLSDYYDIIRDLKADETIPKYATNLVYIRQSDSDDMVEDKLIYSIINKQPKRADHYFLVHFSNDDAPDTLNYTCHELIEQTLYAINIRVGYRVNPLMTLYLRQIVEDLIAQHRFDIRSCYPSLRKHNIAGDFRFIVLHRIYYASTVVSASDNFMLHLFGFIRHIGIDDEQALGLDTSNVTVERVPFVINNKYKQRITRCE